LLPRRELGSHYRSLDERLFSFANDQVYGGGVITLPGTGTETAVRLDLVTAQGRDTRAAQAEIDHVVQLVISALRHRPHESIGVVTLTSAHAARIDLALHKALAGNPALLKLLTDAVPGEPFFAKCADRAQGEQREAMIFAVGWDAETESGCSDTYTALSGPDGSARLNVAITRARRRLTVVSAHSASELVSSGEVAPGVELLRDFLDYAGSAEAKRPKRAQEGELPVLVEDLARRLRAEGFVVHTGYGSSEHRIDLVVEDPRRPGQLLMAIETDGPVYGGISATRDRERLRVEQLRRSGWLHERVWTRDLFQDPAQEVARLVAAVHAASLARK
jgi:hypothetical protein